MGRLECVQWLVRHTNLRDKLTSRDGDRSLLHMGAKYGKVSKQNSFITCMYYVVVDRVPEICVLDFGSVSWINRLKKGKFNTAFSSFFVNFFGIFDDLQSGTC